MKKMTVVAVIAMLVASTLGLSGCKGGPTVDELVREDIAAELDGVKDSESTVYKEIVTGIDKGNGEDLEALGISAQDIVGGFLDGFDYKITGVDVDEEAGTAIAHVQLACKSMADVVTTFQTAFEEKLQTMDLGAMTEGDVYKLGGEVMLATVRDAEPRNVDVDIKYIESENGEWDIDESATTALMEAMMG